MAADSTSIPVEDVVAPETQGITSDAAFFRLASTDLLAAETQDYVPKLIAAALIAKAPARYGFSAPAPAPFAYDSLVVHDATGLDVVARLAGTSLAEIRDLNPAVSPPRHAAALHDGDPPAGRHRRRGGRALRRAEPEVAGALPDPRDRRGASGSAPIAARYHLPMREIQAANPKLTDHPAGPGTRLVIPAVAVPSALAMKATGTIGGGRAVYARGTLHRVRRGETLTGIARSTACRSARSGA